MLAQLLVVFLCALQGVSAFSFTGLRTSSNKLQIPFKSGNDFSTALYAHHPQKKIIKKKMDRRPKKHRISDINRNNVNLNKCITKVPNAPSEYTIVSAEDYLKVRENALKFWEEGSPFQEWIEIIEEDTVPTFSQNRDPLPAGTQKRPNLVKSGSV